MELNKLKTSIKDILTIFIPVLIAILIQYGVTICDTIILFIGNVRSDRKVSNQATISELMNSSIDQPMNQAYITFAVYVLYAIIFGLWYKNKFCKDINIKDTFLVKPSKKVITIVATLILAGYASQVFADGIMALAKPHFKKTFEEYDKLSSNITGAGASFLMLFTVFIIAPIGEELLFRGLIQNYSKKIMPASYAIVLQALIFSVYHGNIIQIIYALIFGLVFGFISNYYKSILPAIILHIAINSSLLIVPEKLFDTTKTTIITSIVTLLVAVALVLAPIIISAKANKHESSPQDQSDTQEA